MKAVIYTRVSADRAAGRSVAEQEAECRAACERNGWTVSEILSDNDRGASRHSRKTRPAYARLEKILTECDVLVTWEASRAQRDLEAYVSLRKLCSDRGVLWHYSGITYDLNTGDDRFRTGLDALLAEAEAEKTRDRVLRAHRANAAAGRPHGKIPYGYRAEFDDKLGKIVRRVPNEPEAAVVRELARRVLAGATLRSLKSELNDRGVPGPTGGQWNTYAIRRMLLSPTMAGKRVHHGVVTDAVWEGILTENDHESLVAMLTDPARTVTRGPEPQHLLTGIAVCGLCGARMIRVKNTKYPTYTCGESLHVSRNQRKVDLLVEAAIVARLEDPALIGALAQLSGAATADLAEARRLRQRLDECVNATARGELSAASLGKIEQEIEPMIVAAEARAHAALAAPALTHAAGPGAGVRWKEYPVATRRQLVRELATIRIHPTRTRGPVFDPSLIEVEWL